MRRAQALLNCLMYKLSYYRFGEGALMATGRLGYDRVRQVRPWVATRWILQARLLCGGRRRNIGGCTSVLPLIRQTK